MQSICVFCGSSAGQSPMYKEAATRLGEYLAEQGIELVYGGAQVGLMGAVAGWLFELRWSSLRCHARKAG